MLIGVVGAGSRSGSAFVRHLTDHVADFSCRQFVRAEPGEGGGRDIVRVADYAEIPVDSLRGCDAVVNFVGAVEAGSLDELRHVNVTVPERLATAMGEAGVPFMVQMSSLSIHGPQPLIGRDTPIEPTTDYGRTKVEAERAIAAAARDKVAVCYLRVPTIYGPNGPSKLGTLASILRRLPAFPVPNPAPQRSVIGHENLTRVIVQVARDRLAGTVYAADPEPFTLPMMAAVLPGRPRMVSLPAIVLKPLGLVAPGPYTSLYESGEIAPDLLVGAPDLVPTQDSLQRAFGHA